VQSDEGAVAEGLPALLCTSDVNDATEAGGINRRSSLPAS
jgi:hypothetical protein